MRRTEGKGSKGEVLGLDRGEERGYDGNGASLKGELARRSRNGEVSLCRQRSTGNIGSAQESVGGAIESQSTSKPIGGGGMRLTHQLGHTQPNP